MDLIERDFKHLLISLHPRYSQAIFLGTKRVELRRVKPDIEPGDRVVIYETAPTCAIVGHATVRGVLAGSAEYLWRMVGHQCGITKSEMRGYFLDLACGYAIALTDATTFETPVSLASLRKAVPGFAPPQSYHYLRAERPKDRKLHRHLHTVANLSQVSA